MNPTVAMTSLRDQAMGGDGEFDLLMIAQIFKKWKS